VHNRTQITFAVEIVPPYAQCMIKFSRGRPTRRHVFRLQRELRQMGLT